MKKQILSQVFSLQELRERMMWLEPTDIKDICKITGVSHVYLSNIKTGKIKSVRQIVADSIMKISEANICAYENKINQILNNRPNIKSVK